MFTAGQINIPRLVKSIFRGHRLDFNGQAPRCLPPVKSIFRGWTNRYFEAATHPPGLKWTQPGIIRSIFYNESSPFEAQNESKTQWTKYRIFQQRFKLLISRKSKRRQQRTMGLKYDCCRNFIIENVKLAIFCLPNSSLRKWPFMKLHYFWYYLKS